jgi:hypothetical protein
MSQQSILATIKPITDQYDVPSQIIATIIQVESNWNPNALGDNGTSYGLFQLHTPGGQGDRAIGDGHKPSDLFDPVLNARYAMPAIASAWNNLKGSFDPSNLAWWLDFAAQSGHPGGSRTNPATINEATALQRVYHEPSPNPGTAGIPQGWSDDGTTLKAPNGRVVVMGFRQWVLSHNWDPANLPLENEHGQTPLEVSNPALGGGTQQLFRWKVLEWTPARGVFEMWAGQEFLALRQQWEGLMQQVQTLQQELAALKGHA